MILDKIENLDSYGNLNPLFPTAFQYLQQTDLKSLEPGKYAIQGEEVYAIVQEYQTKPRETGCWEAHRDYIDVHVMYEGEESMGYNHIGELRSRSNYVPEKDLEQFDGTGFFFSVPQGYFAVFAPQDAHMPCLQPGRPTQVRKVVLKIRAK